MASGIRSLTQPINNEDTPDSTADQDAWLALTRAMMDQFGKIIPHMELMDNQNEVHALVEAAWTTFALHRQAMILDKYVELELAKTTPD